jgi:hypothetical protein
MYQVLEAIIHRERVHAEERCILLLADFSAKKYHDYRELEAFFDEVLLFPYRLVSNDPETILEETEQAYRDSVPMGSRSSNIFTLPPLTTVFPCT